MTGRRPWWRVGYAVRFCPDGYGAPVIGWVEAQVDAGRVDVLWDNPDNPRRPFVQRFDRETVPVGDLEPVRDSETIRTMRRQRQRRQAALREQGRRDARRYTRRG